MANLLRRENFFQDLFDFRREVDQMFNRFFNWPSEQERHLLPSGLVSGFTPAVESFIDKDGKTFHCQIMLPGVDPKNVNIQVLGDALSVTGERSSCRETKEADYLHREISYGSFQRTLTLPPGVDREKLSAEYNNGVLEITAPISAAALPRKIEVKALPAAKKAGA